MERAGQVACAKVQADHLVKHPGLNLERFMEPRVIFFMLIIIPYFPY